MQFTAQTISLNITNFKKWLKMEKKEKKKEKKRKKEREREILGISTETWV